MRGIRGIWGKRSSSEEGVPDTSEDRFPLNVASPCYVIGDVHGSLKPLETLLRRVLEDWAQPACLPVTFLGDYVDRGDQIREVVGLLQALQAEPGWEVTCLKGNHEAMLLEFLEDPAGKGPRWLRNGGLQTLASYKVGGVHSLSDAAGLEDLALRLEAAVGGATLSWLRALPTYAQNGNLILVHAAVDPNLPMARQETRTLLWGHPAFLKRTPGEERWVAHGHTVVDAPKIQQRRIALDTGAFATGILTAGYFEPGAVPRFLQSPA